MILPFDKDILDTTIDDVKTRLVEINLKRRELELILTSMISIQDEVFFTTDPDTGAPKKETRVKKDPDTREDFTTARRNTIYDMNVPLAQTKISETI